MQGVKCGCGILSNVEWLDAILVRCGMLAEMQCVMWDSVMCNLYLGVMWNGVPMWGSDLM